MYDSLSRDVPWVTIECFDPARNSVRPPSEIAKEVWAAIQPVIAGQLASASNSGAR
jgi:hypothetical protein